MGLLPPFQSPYTSYTTLYGDSRHQEILYNMMGIVDQGCVCTLVLLDLSAAFNTVDHSVILETLKTRFTVDGDALGWVADFLSKRSQSVSYKNVKSEESALDFGVPQGWMLGLRTINQYSEDVSELFHQHHLRHHFFPKTCNVTATEDAICTLSSTLISFARYGDQACNTL